MAEGNTPKWWLTVEFRIKSKGSFVVRLKAVAWVQETPKELILEHTLETGDYLTTEQMGWWPTVSWKRRQAGVATRPVLSEYIMLIWRTGWGWHYKEAFQELADLKQGNKENLEVAFTGRQAGIRFTKMNRKRGRIAASRHLNGRKMYSLI